MLEELWMKVCDTVQKTVIKTIIKKKKSKKEQCLSEKVLKLAKNRRKAKGKREKERYTHLKGFQRIAKSDKKTFLNANKQKKAIKWEILEISSRKLTISIEDFMGTIKDKNGMDLTEADDTKKKQQEHTEKNYTKMIFMTQIITMM